MTYDERVREVAEEFIHDAHVKATGDKWYEDMIVKAMPLARIAVRLQAEEARLAYDHCNTEPVFNPIGIDKHLTERGLIDPSKCQSCDWILITDDTGKYCDNNKCDKFWQTK